MVRRTATLAVLWGVPGGAGLSSALLKTLWGAALLQRVRSGRLMGGDDGVGCSGRKEDGGAKGKEKLLGG